MHLALFTNPSAPEARYARQLGLRHVVSGAPASEDGVIPLEALQGARAFFDAQGLAWEVIENLPTPHYDKLMFGLPGRDEQIEKVQQTLRNMGRAGIGVLQYQWMLLGGLRTEYSPTGRGGARVSRFDLEVARRAPAASMVWRGAPGGLIHLPDRDLPDAQVWDNLLYFLRGVLPVAEEVGVKLAVHPDDPPLPEFMGVARIMSSLEAFQRLVDTLPSPCNGLGFCQGTISAIPGVDIPSAIRRFGGQGRIFFGHFRNSIGSLPRFDEVFPDEGDTDLLAVLQAYREVGYDGLLRIDHSPGVIGDNATADRGFAYQVGYARALEHVVQRADTPPAAASALALPLALTLDALDDEMVILAQQLGVSQVVAQPAGWEVAALAALRNRVEKAGLQLVALDDLPAAQYAQAILGGPEREAQIAWVCQAIRNAGAAGISLVSYGWTPPGAWRTGTVAGRGGALLRAYAPVAEAGPSGAPSATQLWANLESFLRQVLPVAAAAGVCLACRPDDPPLPARAGAPRILSDLAGLTRLLELAPGPWHGLDLQHGSVSLMPGAHLPDLIRRWGAQGRILMVGVGGLAPGYRQTFLDEDAALLPALLAYREVGFRGPLRAAPPPALEGDTPWGHKGRALDLGYLQALARIAR